MRKCLLWFGLAMIGSVYVCPQLGQAQSAFVARPFPADLAPAEFYIFENSAYQVWIGRRRGIISRIRDKIGQLDLLVEPRLADNWRFCLPIPPTLIDPGTQANYFLGKDQTLSSVEQTSNSVTLRWAGPLKNADGTTFPLSAAMVVSLAGGGIEFRFDMTNNSPLKIMEVWYPLLGGIQGLANRRATLVHIPWRQGEKDGDIFWNTRLPYELGNPFPEYLYPVEPGKMPESWMDVYNKAPGRGFYFGLHAGNGGGRRILRIEMQPGVGVSRQGDSWPRPDELTPDIPVGLTLGWVYFFDPKEAHAGNDFHGGTAVLRAHDGDWHAAANFYPR
jgi:hypothetical protein